MKKLDQGQKILAGIVLGVGAIIIATQIALYFANRQKPNLAPAIAPIAPSAVPVPGQV
jgi:hypothetical protein